MPRRKCDINVGIRMREECDRLFPSVRVAAERLGVERKSLSSWRQGMTPEVLIIARLYYLGGDVIYILTGKKSGVV